MWTNRLAFCHKWIHVLLPQKAFRSLFEYHAGPLRESRVLLRDAKSSTYFGFRHRQLNVR